MKTRLVIVLAALALLTSCVHEFPVTTPANVDLVLTFDTKMSYYNTRLFPDETSQIPDVNAEPSTEVPSDEHLFVPDYAKMGDYDLRYTIEAYRQIAEDTYSSQPVQRWVLTDADATKLDEYAFQVTLDEGRYIFRAWADFVPEGSTAEQALLLAIGNPLGELEFSMSTGHVSALDREVTVDGVTRTVIQTDAAINPGNSGGPLLNAKGELIGINNAKLVAQDVEGIGYAIPISKVADTVNMLLSREEIRPEESAYLGVSGQDVTESLSEALNMPMQSVSICRKNRLRGKA